MQIVLRYDNCAFPASCASLLMKSGPEQHCARRGARRVCLPRFFGFCSHVLQTLPHGWFASCSPGCWQIYDAAIVENERHIASAEVQERGRCG